MNENDDQLQQPDAALPTWQEVQQAPEFQTAKPEDKLVAFSRWHDAAYNAAQATPDWNDHKDEFNRQAAQIQSQLSTDAGGIDPDMARIQVAMGAVKDQENSLGRSLTDDEKASTVNDLGPDVAKAYHSPPSITQRLYRPVAAFGEGFAGGLGQTLQTLGYFASQPGSMVTKLENKLFGTPTQEETAKKFTGDEHPLEWLGQRLQKVATTPEAESALDPRTKGGISEAVGHTAGGLLEFLGESALGGAELKAAGLIPKILSKETAGKLAGMSVFGIHNAAEGINHARDLGVSEDQVLSSALTHGVIGAGTAAISPFQKWMSKFDEATGGGLTTTLKKAATEGGQFAAQMFAQQFGNNLSNKAVLADNTDLLKDTFEQAKSGGATGIVASLVLSTLLHGTSALKLPPSVRGVLTKETSTGKVSIEADQDALDKISKMAETSPEAAAAGEKAVTGKVIEGPTETHEQAAANAGVAPVPGVDEAGNLPAVTSGSVVQDTINATKTLLQKPRNELTPTDVETIKNGRLSAMWEWARTNSPELRGAIHDAAGRGDDAARDNFYNQLREQFRNSPEAGELGIKATVEQQAAKPISDLANGTATVEDFTKQVGDIVSGEAGHEKTLPTTARQPQGRRPQGIKEVSEEEYQKRLAAGGQGRYSDAETDSIVKYLQSGEEFQKESSDKTPKFKGQISEGDFIQGRIDDAKSKAPAGKLSLNQRADIAKQAKQEYATRTAPTVTAEGGITPTRTHEQLVQEYSDAKAREDAKVAGASEVSPGKAIGRSPAEIERDIIVNQVKEARAKAAGKPFNVREAVTQAKVDFENQFKTEEFNPFVEPGEAEYTRAHDELVKQGVTPTRGAVAQKALEIKAAQKAQVKIFAQTLKEQLAKEGLTPEQKMDYGQEFVRKAKEVEGTIYQNRTQQAEHYIDPKSDEYKNALEQTLEEHELKQGFPSVTDSRGYAKDLGNARAKALWERVHQKLAELYPAEPTPNAEGVKLHTKNVWAKTGKEKTEKTIETSTGQFKTILTGGKQEPKLITEAQSPITGDPLYVLEHKPTGRSRYLWTGDPRTTVQVLGRMEGGQHFYVPDNISNDKISPALHIQTDPLTGERYVASVDTVFGNIAEPGTRSTDGNISEPLEFEKLYDQKYGRFQRASKAVQLGDQEKIDFLNNKFDEEAARQPATPLEEEAPPAGQATGTIADIWPDQRASQIDETAAPDYETGDQGYREAEAAPTDYENSYDAMIAEVDKRGMSKDNFVDTPDTHLGDPKTNQAAPIGETTPEQDRAANMDAIQKLGLDGPQPALNALRSLAVDPSTTAAQRQLVKDLLANPKLDLANTKINIFSDRDPESPAGRYLRDSHTVLLNSDAYHEGGLTSTLLHELGHHTLYRKLEADYKGNSVETRATAQLSKLYDYAKTELYKAEHDGIEGTPKEIESWLEDAAAANTLEKGYPLINLQEFAASIFSRDSNIEDTFGKIEALKGGKFQEFVNKLLTAIKELFTGKVVTKGSLYDQALNEIMGLTREGEFKPERLIPRLAAETAAAEQKQGQTQQDINGALQQMNRQQLEQEATASGLHKDEILSMTGDELRSHLGMRGVVEGSETLGEGYGGWLDKNGEYHASPHTAGGHETLAYQILDENHGVRSVQPYKDMFNRGYVRIVNDSNKIYVGGEPTPKQLNQIVEQGMLSGRYVEVDNDQRVRTVYSPRQVFAKAGTPQAPNTNPQPNVSFLKGVDLIVAGRDAANNVATRRGGEAKTEVRQDFSTSAKLTPEVKQDMNATSLVRQAGGEQAFMLNEMKKIQNSTKIDQKEKDRWLPIYQHGYDNFARLNDKAQNGMFDKLMTEQADRLHAADIPVRVRDNYISQMVDKPEADSAGIWDFLKPDDGSAGSSRFFLKGKKFNTFADAIAAGYLPKSEGTAHPLDISEITHRYVELTERLIQTKALEERLENTLAHDGKPIIGATEEYKSAAGNIHTTTPRGYKIVATGGKPLVVHEDYAPIMEYAYSDSNLPKPLRKTLGFIKRNTLMFDTFHVGRILAKTVAYSKGESRFGYGKGLSLLEYSDRAWDTALQSGEVTPEMDKFRNEKVYGDYSRRQIMLELEKQGANFGRVADNLYAAHASSIPYLKSFNPWVFQKLSRGAMAQTSVANWIRNMQSFPERGVEGNARQTAKEYNEVFGNLQSQRIFKNKFYKNALDAVALAPNWAESQLLAEGRGVAQIGRGVYDTLRGNPRLGTVAKGQLTVVLGMLAANQLMNYISKGHSTFENTEPGHKLDAFIPDVESGGRGFWFSPFEIGAEYIFALHKYMAQHQTPVDALAQVAKNKLNPLARGTTELVSGRDYAGRKFNSTTDRITAAISDAAPIPLTLGGVLEKDARAPLGLRFNRQPGSDEKQLLQSIGLKTSNYQSPRSEMFALAYPFRNDKSYTDNAGEYTDLRRALDNDNHDAAVSEIRLLASRGHTEKQLKAAVGMSPTGSVAPENFTGSKSKEAEMRKALSLQQLELYKQAQKDHVSNAKAFLHIFKEVRPDLLEVLKANDKARK